MTDQEKLIKFMRAKRAHLIWLTGGCQEAVNYFTDEDAQDIRKWSDENTRYVKDCIIKILKVNTEKDGTGGYLCPYCYYKGKSLGNSCFSCTYFKRRGQTCGNARSNYARLYWAFKTIDEVNLFEINKRFTGILN